MNGRGIDLGSLANSLRIIRKINKSEVSSRKRRASAALEDVPF